MNDLARWLVHYDKFSCTQDDNMDVIRLLEIDYDLIEIYQERGRHVFQIYDVNLRTFVINVDNT